MRVKTGAVGQGRHDASEPTTIQQDRAECGQHKCWLYAVALNARLSVCLIAGLTELAFGATLATPAVQGLQNELALLT